MTDRPTVLGRGVLEQFTTDRMAIARYHDAYLDALTSEGRPPRDDSL